MVFDLRLASRVENKIPARDEQTPDLNRGPSAIWKQIDKKYFSKDPSKLCFVEEDQALAGNPLWPEDPTFIAKQIDQNLEVASEILEKIGGHVVRKHVVLHPDRRFSQGRVTFSNHPKRLHTTFVSGFLIPREAIQQSQIGFHIKDGKIPSLKKSIERLKGTWLLTNLGYFLTPKLISEVEKGGCDYSHNTRHSAAEQLLPTANGYLGGFFVRKKNQFVAYPPHLQTGGVALDVKGQPHLVGETKLLGGTVWFGKQKCAWKAKDVNPSEESAPSLIVYTPNFTNAETKQTILDKSWKSYRPQIGANRVNVVVVNEGVGNHPAPKIACIVDGMITQPAAGIVFSFDKNHFKKIFPAGIQKLKKTKVRFEFEPWFDKKLWKNCNTFYEGLMPLDRNGKENFGIWNHPHALLTQETYILNAYRREPYVVLVQTGKYFGAIAFSGRYEYSIGISVAEMVPVVNACLSEVIPDQKLEQILRLDGGSGAKICLIKNGKPFALNWIAPGPRNRLGDPMGNTYSSFMIKPRG